MAGSISEGLSAQPVKAFRRQPRVASIGAEDIARAARELVDAYGPEAIALMRKRTRAVRRRGDAESASLWSAVARAIVAQLAASIENRTGGAAD